MYRNSEMLEKIIKKYKLEIGMKIDISLLKHISQKEKIDIKDLLYILEINQSTYYRLNKSKQKYTKLKFYQYWKIKALDEGEIINKWRFMAIKEEWDIKNFRLVNLLGMTTYQYYKMTADDKYEVTAINVEAKHNVNLMKIDFKYIKNYGSRYYKIEELTKQCQSREITINQFLKYYSNNIRHYKFNKMIIEKSKKGFWISGKMQLSKKFLNNNYNLLYSRCKLLSTQMAYSLNCDDISYKDDFCNIAMLKIIEEGEQIIKTFYFDKNLAINILMKKARYGIYSYYKKEENRIKHYNAYEYDYLERTNIINKY